MINQTFEPAAEPHESAIFFEGYNHGARAAEEDTRGTPPVILTGIDKPRAGSGSEADLPKFLPFAEELRSCLAMAKRVAVQFSTSNVDVPLLFYAAAIVPEGRKALIEAGLANPEKLVREMAGELAIDGQGNQSCEAGLSSDLSTALVLAMASAMRDGHPEVRLAPCLDEAIAILRSRKVDVLADVVVRNAPLKISDVDDHAVDDTGTRLDLVNEKLTAIEECVGDLRAQVAASTKAHSSESASQQKSLLLIVSLLLPITVLLGVGIGHALGVI